METYSSCKTPSVFTKEGDDEFLNDFIEGIFNIPRASNLSPQISTNCCLDLSVKQRPNESIKYLKSIDYLLVIALNKGVPLATKFKIEFCLVSVPSGKEACLILNPLSDKAL